MVLFVSLWTVIVEFSGHSHLLFEFDLHSKHEVITFPLIPLYHRLKIAPISGLMINDQGLINQSGLV